MTVRKLAEKLGWKLIAGEKGILAEVKGCSSGDLLSWVLSHGRQGQVWLTVMGTETAVAVAVLSGFSAIVLAGGAELDAEAARQADEKKVPVYSCRENLYEAAIRIYEALSKTESNERREELRETR